MNVLITGIGGPTPRSIAKRMRVTHPDIRIIGIDANPQALGFYMPGLVDHSLVAPRVTNPDYWSFIESLIDRENIDLAFVQPEKEVIAWGNYYNEQGKYPCPVLIPPVELALPLMNKSLMSDVLKDTEYIPKTLTIDHDDTKLEQIEKEIGYPCWIRANEGSGGLGSLKITSSKTLKPWLFVYADIPEFTVSEFLPGRHLANQMLYINGEYVKGASLECAEYVMASIAPSKITGNTSYGRFLNEENLLSYCDDVIRYMCEKLQVKPHGVFSFDLKEDHHGKPKVTEINIRHMAYTGIMAEVGFDLIGDTITLLTEGPENIIRDTNFHYAKPYAFLRDVDIEPIILDDRELLA
jgi:hypothetical protein